MAYRKFDTGTWQDPWFEDLSPKAKLAFIYLWTNEICTPAGIYEISEKRIKFELGYGIDTIYSEINTKVIWDQNRKFVWVKNFFRRQCQNAKFAISAINSIKDDPYKLQLFIDYNRDFLNELTINGTPVLDTISIPYPTEQNRTDTDTVSEADTDTDCSELQNNSEPQPEKTTPPIIKIPLTKKEEYPIYQSDFDDWAESYPAVDIMQELRNIRQWNLSNPNKRKTKNGVRKHITNWLAKEQNRGGNGRNPPNKFTIPAAARDQHNQDVLKRFIERGDDE